MKIEKLKGTTANLIIQGPICNKNHSSGISVQNKPSILKFILKDPKLSTQTLENDDIQKLENPETSEII